MLRVQCPWQNSRFHRAITRPFFTRDRISDLDIFGEHVDGAISQAKTHLREGYPIDIQVYTSAFAQYRCANHIIQDMLTRITLDSGTAFVRLSQLRLYCYFTNYYPAFRYMRRLSVRRPHLSAKLCSGNSSAQHSWTPFRLLCAFICTRARNS